ncbi:unannotated protein [freshwater metagenome]|uniref:Unannotated protein n=1 Tax=freshwater metagenome TaxID=449393 RepID=A0A6J6PSB5_9ZZZZ
MRVPSTPWPQPCGRLTTPGRISSLISTGASTLPTRLVTLAYPPFTRPNFAASSGCTVSVQRTLPLTNTLMLCIHELFERKCRRPTSVNWSGSGVVIAAARRSTSPMSGAAASSIRPDGVRKISGKRGSRAPKSTPCGLSISVCKLTACGFEPNPSPKGPVRNMKSSVRSGPRWPVSANIARISSASRPRMGEFGSDTEWRTNEEIDESSTIAGSASTPLPCSIIESFAMTSHSSG